MKFNKRKKKISEIVSKMVFVDGYKLEGQKTYYWFSTAIGDQQEDQMKLELNTSMAKTKKMKLELNTSIQTAKLGDLVTHKEHPLGLGLVIEQHPEYNAFRVDWIEHSELTLFIDEKVLLPINKERTHESDDL